jgi:AsmA protein
MKGALKWAGIVVGALVLILIAALLIIPQFIDIQKYKPVLEGKVAEATGRPFSIGGDLQLSLFPWAGVSLSDLTLGNPEGFAEKQFVSIQSFDVRVKLLPLLTKDIQVKRFILNQPKIVLVKTKGGRGNWTQPKKAAPAVEEKTGPSTPATDVDLPVKALAVGEFSVKDGVVVFIDQAAGTRRQVTDIDLNFSDVSLEKPVKMAFSALLDGKPVSAKGTVGPVGKTIGRQPIAFDLTVETLKQLTVMLKGQVNNPLADPSANLSVTVSEFSPRRLMDALGAALPVQTADPAALSRLALKAQVSAGPRSVAISGGELDLDDSKMAFNLKASEFDRPNVAFEADLDKIDLDRYLPPESEKKDSAPEKKEASKPAEKPDYEPLRKLILDGSVKIGELTVRKASLQQLLVKVKAKNGVIRIDPAKMNLYDGTFAAQTIVDVRTDTPATKLSLDLEGVQVNPLLRDFMDKDILEGSTRARIELSMQGDDAATVKRTLDGSGQLSFTDGAIKGVDLAAMARNTKAAFGLAQPGAERPRTDFTELNVPFAIKAGRFSTPQAELKSPFIRLKANGAAHLVRETIDFRVDPKLVGTIKGQGDTQKRSGLLVPVVISGTFGKPEFRPDLEALARQRLDVDKKTLEKTGKELLESQVKELTDPESAGEKPEDKAKGLLKGLFNRD